MLVAGCPSALAQQPASSVTLSGNVEDSTGGAIVGAQVTLLDAAGNVKARTATNSEGHFSLPELLPGKYVLQAERKSFSTSRKEVLVSSTTTAETPLLIRMRVASVQQTVNVTASGAYAFPDAAGATKTDTPIMETPVSVQVIPRQVLEDQQIIRLTDALQNVSGVIQSNDGYGTADSFTIRGFDQAEMTYEDGLRLDQYSTSGFPVDLANLDRVEVAKGPASVLYGQAEPGGLVNIVTKKPLDAPYYSLQQQFGSFGVYRTTLDVTGPLASKTLFYRFILDYENAGSFRDFISTHRLSLFPSLQWKPNEQNQVTLQLKYGMGSYFLDNGIPFLSDGTPANIPTSRNLAEPNTNRSPVDEYAIKLLASHDFNDAWKLHATYKSEYNNNPSINAQYYSGDADASGNLPMFGLTNTIFKQWTHQVDAGLTGKFEALGLKHTVIVGFDDYYQAGHYNYNFYIPATINIYNPVYGQPDIVPVDPANEGYVYDGQHAYGVYAQDQVALPGHLHLLAGLRFDRVNTYDTGYGQATSVHDHPVPTPRVGILWQPKPQVSLYASYTGNYGATSLGAITPNGVPLPPESDKEYEAGVKTEWLNKRLSATASIYRITKSNIPAVDPADPRFSIAIGEARSRGLELDVSGQITANWKIIGGYSYIDCVVTKDDNGASTLIHRAHLLRSSDRPIMVSVVDTHENISKLLPALDQMVDEGLIAMSDVEVIKYVHQEGARSPAS